MFSKKPEFEKPNLVIEAAESAEVAANLGAEIAARFGPREEAPFSLALRDAAGALLGGLNGVIHWRWLYIRHLWVAPSWRRRGFAKNLIDSGEREARARGAIGAYIDTFDPAVAGFYERQGYARCGEIADFPPGAKRIYLSKRLVGDDK
ncbi:GNAT family N-acetyltransferase [Methylocystis sp. MJC1]|jgi:GNAT superfamily N-acetyltransferase|uniref:GNAT family N-acetyltransferase n=1 Tax=Methylocystis sp. MJC1 TaxID=2654282 RepID=UPI0013EDAD16|nr:GNAT family N-acetyltransferase [Methylocystis sp. MJC1]MBU6528654.1 GNAT family N-acetyltransferase [Methylocystis sp. MJC1]UZX11544.1 GNAT family N-acetyltransferase [Methylocystis sp. MJC1]